MGTVFKKTLHIAPRAKIVVRGTKVRFHEKKGAAGIAFSCVDDRSQLLRHSIKAWISCLN